MILKTALVSFLTFAITASGEDWSVNGKNYHNVKVGEVETDRVHVIYDGGVGTIALADLPPELQKRFNYDPAKAKVASQQREKMANDAANDLASCAEAEKPNVPAKLDGQG